MNGISSQGLAVLLVVLLNFTKPLNGQELEPRAYSVSPVGINIALFSYSYPSGDVEFDPSLPIERQGQAERSYLRSDTFGRSIS
jgi:hypothetical protein